MRASVKIYNLFMLIGLLTNISCYAVSAYRPKIKIAVEGGETYIQLCGDESCKYAITEDGYTILRDSIGWLYAVEDNKGNVVPSKYRLVHKSIENPDIKDFLYSTKKGLVPSVEKQKNNTLKRQTSRQSIEPVVGQRNALIILMQFSDKKFTIKKEEFDLLFNSIHYNDDGAIGSVYDYYKEMSYGQLDLQSDIIGPFTARNDMAYYGRNSSLGGGDKNPFALFEEALEYAKSKVDFSKYDSDRDGYIDNIHIIFAGYGEESGASPNTIWSHEMTFDQPLSIGPYYVDRYSCSPELRGNKGIGISRIGVICHEIGHALGAMDFYDTNYGESGEYYGTGEWDIMAQGSWNDEGINPADFNPYIKVTNFGWISPSIIIDKTSNNVSTYTIKPNEIYQINTEFGYDYFLLENVRKKGVFSSIHGEGLMIYHIGENIDNYSKTNSINTTYPQECYPVCASARSSYPIAGSLASFGSINSSGCPYPGSSDNTDFSKNSYPAALDYHKNYIGISLIDIEEDKDDNVIFKTIREESDHFKSLWHETFDNAKLSDIWEQSNIKGNGSWTLRKELYNMSGESSKKNNGYLMLQSLDNTNSLNRNSISNILKSDIININSISDSLLLSFDLKNEHKIKKNDYLTIYINTVDVGISDSIQLTFAQSIDWREVRMPFKNTNQIQLLFKSDIDSSSKLYLDNISIHVINQTYTGLKEYSIYKHSLYINSKRYDLFKNFGTKLKVYNTNGALVDLLDLDLNNNVKLPNGVYIISDGYNEIKIYAY